MSTIPQTIPVPPALLLALVEAVEAEWGFTDTDTLDDATAARELLVLNGVSVDPVFGHGAHRSTRELAEILRGAS